MQQDAAADEEHRRRSHHRKRAHQPRRDPQQSPSDRVGEAGAAVYVVAGDLATRTPVKVGLETAEAVELVSGVVEGQTVLVSSVHGLGEKARLAAKP